MKMRLNNAVILSGQTMNNGVRYLPLIAIAGFSWISYLTQPGFSQDIATPTTDDQAIPPTQPLSPSDLDSQLTSPQTLDLETSTVLDDFPDPVPNFQGFNYIGNFTVFSEAELNTCIVNVSEYQNRPVTLAELLLAVNQITDTYIAPPGSTELQSDDPLCQGLVTKGGYVTSGAFIPLDANNDPEQILQTGIVTIQIVEGSLEDIRISGLRHLNEGYVRNRISTRVQAPLQQGDLLEALQLIRLDPLIDTISADIAAGSGLGLNVLNVLVSETERHRILVGLDNNRSPSVGTFRLRSGYQINNLLGFGDQFGFTYENTEGSDSFNNINYQIPLNAKDGTLSFDFSTTESRIIEDPFDSIDIRSPSQEYNLTFRQPFFRRIDESATFRELAAGLTLSHTRNDTSLLGIPFQLSSGADEEGRTRTSVIRAFADYNQQSNRDALSARFTFNVGIGAFDATQNEGVDQNGFEIPDSNFLSTRLQGQYVAVINENAQWEIRTDIQFADRPLLPSEQFGIGGQATVRGYRQDALITDNGAVLSAEYRRSIPGLEELKVAPFFDFGIGWNSGGRPNPTQNTIAGIGLGLLWEPNPDLRARFDWGIPLNTIPTSRATSWQENGLYFTVQYAPRF